MLATEPLIQTSRHSATDPIAKWLAETETDKELKKHVFKDGRLRTGVEGGGGQTRFNTSVLRVVEHLESLVWSPERRCRLTRLTLHLDKGLL